MRNLFTLICLLATIISTNAQVLIDPSPASGSGSAGDAIIKAPTFVLNNSNAPADLAWERIDVSLPAG